jgi:hypothetical protein
MPITRESRMLAPQIVLAMPIRLDTRRSLKRERRRNNPRSDARAPRVDRSRERGWPPGRASAAARSIERRWSRDRARAAGQSIGAARRAHLDSAPRLARFESRA